MAAAVPAPQTHRVTICPNCMTRSKVRLDRPKGKRVNCPKCKQPFDPDSAQAGGTNRLKTQAALAQGDDPGAPEWVWALVIGGGGGVLVGALLGYIGGMTLAGLGGPIRDGFFSNIAVWVVIGMLGYALYGTAISLAMYFTGGSLAGYVVAGVLVVPVTILMFLGLDRFGAVLGIAGTLGFAVAIERAIDYKLYS